MGLETFAIASVANALIPIFGASAAGTIAGAGTIAATAYAGKAAYDYGAGVKQDMKRQERAGREAQEALASAFEFEMPSFDFAAAPPPPPPPPPVQEVAPPPPAAPTTALAARRVGQEAQREQGRRRTLSLFSSSKEKEGRESTILTSSVGAPGAPPVRRRSLGGTSVLGGA
jgi:hypothetical protein